ncbi:MAG: DUF348 domain-containing protein [Anaerolineae bacterium]|nr:DUF348 domain-containing protein [Anaerolineae bacterium]
MGRRRKWTFGLVIAAAVVGASALLVYRATRISVTLDVDGVVRQIYTRAGTVRAVLDESNILIDPEDVVLPALDTQLSGGETITVRKAVVVALQVGDSAQRVRTQSVHPLDVLAERAIPVGLYDVIQVDGQSFAPGELEQRRFNATPTHICVIHSAAIRLIDAGQMVVIHTTEADVGRAFDAAGIELYRADRVTPGLSTLIQDRLTVEIERSVPVSVIADGRRLETRALGPTVGDALAFIGLAPLGADFTIPPLETSLKPEMVIRLVRVTGKVVTEEQVIPFDTIYQPDPALALDEERVIQPGTDGKRAQQIYVRYEDGQEVSRTVQQEWVVEPSTPRLIATGPTKETPSP